MAMTPFKVTAHLVRGVVTEEYSLDLAGLLASRMWRAAKHAPQVDSMIKNPEDFDLPLDICDHGEDWHWLGTTGHAQALTDYPQEPRTYYRVVNDSWVARAADRPLPYYHPRSSAYRDVMMPAHVLLTPTITWWGVGELDKVEALLSPITEMGKRRMVGEGKILRWSFEEVEAEDRWAYGHTGELGDIARPIPVACAKRLTLNYETVWHAIRPPSWNPNRLRKLAVKAEDQMYLPEEWEL